MKIEIENFLTHFLKEKFQTIQGYAEIGYDETLNIVLKKDNKAIKYSFSPEFYVKTELVERIVTGIRWTYSLLNPFKGRYLETYKYKKLVLEKGIHFERLIPAITDLSKKLIEN